MLASAESRVPETSCACTRRSIASCKRSPSCPPAICSRAHAKKWYSTSPPSSRSASTISRRRATRSRWTIKVLDKMRDVMLHALRKNRWTTASKRRPSGAPQTKPEKAKISIKCAWEQNTGSDRKSLIFEIVDDGAGIDIRRVKAKAYEQRLFSEQELATLGAPEVMQILFRPGFSLARRVTTVSGRVAST